MAKKRLIIALVVFCGLVILVFPHFSRYQKLSSECRKLESDIEELERRNKELEEEIFQLENDIEYVERRAREKLGVVKKDEIPYRMIEGGNIKEGGLYEE